MTQKWSIWKIMEWKPFSDGFWVILVKYGYFGVSEPHLPHHDLKVKARSLKMLPVGLEPTPLPMREVVPIVGRNGVWAQLCCDHTPIFDGEIFIYEVSEQDVLYSGDNPSAIRKRPLTISRRAMRCDAPMPHALSLRPECPIPLDN